WWTWRPEPYPWGFGPYSSVPSYRSSIEHPTSFASPGRTGADGWFPLRSQLSTVVRATRSASANSCCVMPSRARSAFVLILTWVRFWVLAIGFLPLAVDTDQYRA